MSTDIYLLNLTEANLQYSLYLNSEENERAARFATPLLQERFRLTRGWLRKILAGYVALSPEALEFRYSEQGKPFLKLDPQLCGNDKLEFNLAHSGDYAVLAVTKNEPVGIDIEKESRMPDCLGIAKRFFTPHEHQALIHSTEPELLFCHIWTQKEAFLKATGKGIGFGLDTFEVSTELNTVTVKHIQDSELAKQNWQSELLLILPNYRIVVTKINDLQLKLVHD